MNDHSIKETIAAAFKVADDAARAHANIIKVMPFAGSDKAALSRMDAVLRDLCVAFGHLREGGPKEI